MRRTLLLALPFVVATVASAASLRPAAADPPAPPAAASASATPAASVAAPPLADGGGAATPKPPPHAPRRFLEGFPDGDERSPKPKPAEWGAAASIEVSRTREGCSAFRIREYVRITCVQRDDEHRGGQGMFAFERYIYGARVVSGSEEGVEVIPPVWEPKKRPFGKHGVDIVIPVRPGDRRTLLVDEVIPVWKSTTPDEGVRSVISETWLPGAPGPTIVME